MLVGELNKDDDDDSCCAICLDPLRKRRTMEKDCKHIITNPFTVVKLVRCNHFYHKACLTKSMDRISLCPVCRHPIQRSCPGTMPSATLTIRRRPQHHLDIGGGGGGTMSVVVLEYVIPENIQNVYHPHPTQTHGGAHYTSVFPDTATSGDLIRRLKFAFRHGLTFAVYSPSTNLSITREKSFVFWRHPSLSGSDSKECHQKLDEMFVPLAKALL